MTKLCLRSAVVVLVVAEVMEDVESYSPLPREGGKWNAEEDLPIHHYILVSLSRCMRLCVPASDDVGEERELVPGNIDLLCPIIITFFFR